MNDNFFDWLNECPAQWVLNETDSKDNRTYCFYNNTEEEKEAICLNCKTTFNQDRDLQICDECINLFNTDDLWKRHDNGELDALDFNESEKLREQFRKVL